MCIYLGARARSLGESKSEIGVAGAQVSDFLPICASAADRLRLDAIAKD